jgi:hypothetical protein
MRTVSNEEKDEKKAERVELTVTPLTTKVTSQGKEIGVFAVTAKVKEYTDEVRYHTLLMSQAGVDQLPDFTDTDDFVNWGGRIGSMTLVDKNTTKYKPAHIYLQRIDNDVKSIKHVGTALEEFAFRFSVKQGREGHVNLSAAWSSHVFHYNNGFRSNYEPQNVLIKEYVDSAKETGKRVDTTALGGAEMYLPDETIEEKRKLFGVSRWEIHAAKMQVQPVLGQVEIFKDIPTDLLSYKVLPLLGGEDIINLYQVSKKHKEMIENHLPLMPLKELLKLSAWIFMQGESPMVSVCIKQLKAHGYQLHYNIVGNKKPLDIAVEYNHISLVNHLLREGIKLHSKHLIFSLEHNNLETAKAIIERFDTTELWKDEFSKLVADTIKNKSDNKPLLQILFDILNNTPFMGRSFHGFENSTKDLMHYKLLLACLLDNTEAVKELSKPDNIYYEPVRKAYKFIEENPSPALLKSFINNLGETSWPAKPEDHAFDGKQVVWMHQSYNSYESNNGKYIFVFSLSKSMEDESKLFYQNEGGKLESIPIDRRKVRDMLETKIDRSGTHSTQEVRLQAAEIFKLISDNAMLYHSPVSVYGHIYDKAERSKDDETILMILDFKKSKGLPLPLHQIHDMAIDAANKGDAARLERLLGFTKPEKLVEEAASLFKMHGSDSYILGRKKRMLADDVVALLKEKIETIKPQSLAFIDALMAHLNNNAVFPAQTKGLLSMSAHKNVPAKSTLLIELQKIKNKMTVDFVNYHPTYVTDIGKALSDFQYAIHNKKDKENVYHENLVKFFGVEYKPETYLDTKEFEKQIKKYINDSANQPAPAQPDVKSLQQVANR